MQRCIVRDSMEQLPLDESCRNELQTQIKRCDIRSSLQLKLWVHSQHKDSYSVRARRDDRASLSLNTEGGGRTDDHRGEVPTADLLGLRSSRKRRLLKIIRPTSAFCSNDVRANTVILGAPVLEILQLMRDLNSSTLFTV